jgi:Contact-dependent growth inhibition CdiA C-terminal domain
MSLKINPILPKQHSAITSKPKITPKIADKTKQTNQAVKHLAVRFNGNDETKPPKKTVNDFYQKVLQEQPLNEKDRDNKIKISVNLSKNATLEDYRLATDKAILQKAGYSMLNKEEVSMARGLMGMKDTFNLKNLKDLDKANKLFVTTSQHTIERAKIAGQAVLQFREYESKLKDTNNAEGENETNRIGKDITYGLHHETFRKIGDGIINIPSDTLNFMFGGKTGELNRSTPNFGRAKIGEMYDELAQTDAEVKVPRIDTTGIMPPYKFESQMMRRNLNGIVDGEGPKAGDTISTGASIVAPLVLGRISTPTNLNTLKGLNALPEVTIVPKALPKIGKLEFELNAKLSPAELKTANKLVGEGKGVKVLKEVENQKGVRTPDFEVDGVRTELKTVSNLSGKDMSASLSRRILDGAGQGSNIIIDARNQIGMTEEIAKSGILRAYGAQRKLNNVRISEVRVIGSDFDITLRYKAGVK